MLEYHNQRQHEIMTKVQRENMARQVLASKTDQQRPVLMRLANWLKALGSLKRQSHAPKQTELELRRSAYDHGMATFHPLASTVKGSGVHSGRFFIGSRATPTNLIHAL